MAKAVPTRRAYTLVEVIMVVAIVGILTTLIVVGYGQSRVARELESSAREVVGTIRELQNFALTGKVITANTLPCGFRLSWSGNSYTSTYVYKAPTGSCGSPSTSVIETQTLRHGITFQSASSPDLEYSLPHAGLTAPFFITLCKATQSRSIIVDPNGLVTDTPGGSCS